MNVAQLADPLFWARWIEIMVLNLTLSGDNALVIALAVRHLPRRQALEGRIWGTVGAVVLRILFTGVVVILLRLPLLQAVGGAVLVWIAVRLLIQEEAAHQVRHGTTLLEAVTIIMIADIIMSLDNVLAVAAAARGDLLLVVLGVALSIPIVVWGAGLLARLMGRYPWIVDLGAGILGWVAGGMVVDDPVLRRWFGEAVMDPLRWTLPGVLGVGVIVGGRWWTRRRSRRPGAREGSQA
jgi:YjbE family integral membrane protein